MLDKELRIAVGVIAEKRRASSPWADAVWVPTAVIEGPVSFKPGEVLRSGETATAYFLGFEEIYCHHKETEAYVHNFESRAPALYIVLRRDEEGEHPLPWFVHSVTASPYEAQDYGDSAEDIVERVQMPPAIADAIRAFIDAHHVEVEFKKRKRVDIRHKEPGFGKEPIFVTRKRPTGRGGLDG